MEPCTNLFGTPVVDTIGGASCPKYSLDIKFESRTEKRKPKDSKYCYESLHFLDSWEQYQQQSISEGLRKKRKKKNADLSVWLCDSFPLAFRSLL